jgi:hypothetical protein
MKHLQISIPEEYEIDKAQSTFENIVFKPTVIALPKRWEDLGEIDGCFVHSGSTSILITSRTKTEYTNRNIFATEEQAQASIALAQLSQLMQVYNDGWVPDWNYGDSKYILQFNGELIQQEVHWSTQHFLAFKTKEIRKEFLENFKDLITIAKPLL